MNVITTLLSMAAVLAQSETTTSVAELRKLRSLVRDLGHGDSYYGNHTGYHRGGDNGRDHGVHTPRSDATGNTTESTTSLTAGSSNSGGTKTAKIVILTLLAILVGVLAAYYCCVNAKKKKTQQAMVTAATAPKQADLEEMTSTSDAPTSTSNE